jgi:hypothetical protein
VLVLRGTKKLRDRVKGSPVGDGDGSTTLLGDWFATALFWRPQVVLLVNRRTLLPVFVELAPATTLPDRAPAAIEAVLRRHGVDETFLEREREAMRDVRVAPTDDRSVLGVMNEMVVHATWARQDGEQDLEELSLRLSKLVLGPLRARAGSPDRELAAVLGTAGSPAATPASVDRSASASPTVAGRSKRGHVYQLKVTLLDTSPPVWRRVLVDGSRTLEHLHEVIQAAFGWWDYHLHQFEIGGRSYAVPDPEQDWGDPPKDERRTRLDAVAREGTSFRYVYDFGDGWEHRVVVEKVLPAAEVAAVPSCTAGRRACPPEDCGGTWGYRELLGILADPAHPEHEERLAWLGRPFDADAFDPGGFEANLECARLVVVDDER